MHTTTAVYPWDIVDDPDAAPYLADIGFDGVFLAAAYHAVRARTPRHPRRRIVVVERSSTFRNVGARPLTPPVPLEVLEYDFGEARSALVAAGLACDPWVVALHLDGGARGGAGREVTAFGDILPHAICPSSPTAERQVDAIIAHVADAGSTPAMLVEAIRFHGLDHAGAHDKAGPVESSRAALLSICFCTDCREGMRAAGMDPDALARRVRAGIDTGRAVADTLAGDANALQGYRAGVIGRLAERAARIARAHGVVELSAYGSVDPAFADAIVLPRADTVVIDCWSLPAGLERLRRLRRSTTEGSAPRLAAHVNLLDGFLAEADLDEVWDRLAEAGADAVHAYHAGLAATDTLARLSRTLQRRSA